MKNCYNLLSGKEKEKQIIISPVWLILLFNV